MNPTTTLLQDTIQELTKQKEYHEKHLKDINEKITSHSEVLKLIEDGTTQVD